MRLFLFLSLFLLSLSGFSKVDPPNYDFSLDKFEDFKPDQKIIDIEKKYGQKVVVFKKGPFTTYKFYIEHIRYKFVVLVQSINEVVTDFHARLPNYFLHDIFHQSIINRLGPQDLYTKVEESAVYVWNNKKGLKYIYSGACSITCFPIFYAIQKEKSTFGSEYKSLIELLKSSEYE